MWLAHHPQLVFGIITSIFALYCLTRPIREPGASDKKKAILLGIWTIGIPLFFLIEWWRIPIEITEPEKPEFKSYKESRDLARNVWLAISSFLTLIYFGDYLKKPSKSDLEELKNKAELLFEMSKVSSDPALRFHIEQLKLKIEEYERKSLRPF